MKKRIVFIVVLLMAIMLVGCDKKEKNETSNNGDFELQFLKLENNSQNMIYSPLSIKYALSMLNEGAAGKTKEEIENVIKDITLSKYESIDQNLSFVNAVYIKDTYQEWVREDFIDKLKNTYDAEVRFDAFVDASNINSFIEKKTLGIIKNMLKDELVSNERAKMILMNALAIDMEWASEFSFTDTMGRDFTLADGSKVKATTMQKSEVQSESISFYKDNNVTSLSMDLKKYGDVELEFMAIMPKTSLSQYVKDLKLEDINNIRNNSTLSSNTKVGINISIPKFKTTYDLNLKGDLQRLGINEAFNSMTADFSKMTDDPSGLHINEALHKADIEFTEKGIKAAAVTIFAMYDNSAFILDRPEEVVIDSPFLYVIRDKSNGEIWFLGTLYSPNLWSDDSAQYEQ